MRIELVALGTAVLALAVGGAGWLRRPCPPPEVPAPAAAVPGPGAEQDAKLVALEGKVDRLRRDLDTLGRARDNPASLPDVQALREEVARLDAIIQSTGLGTVAAEGGADFITALRDSVEAAEDRRDVRARLVLTNRDQHRADMDRYGQRLEKLYRQAQPRRMAGPGARPATPESEEEMAAAFQVLLEEYPESYATGMVIAERALSSAMEMNTEDVEEYYRTLTNNAKFASVVTDQGFEAVPALQSYLIRSYLGEGRTAEAQDLLDSLEKNYGGSLVAERGQQGTAVWRAGSEIAREIRQALPPAGKP